MITIGFKRLILSALAGLILTAGAIAAPVLRPEIVVNGPVVTVGDLFADAGIHSGTPLFRSPNPGTSGTVSLAEVRTAAAGAGITEFQHSGLLAVSVSRSGAIVDASLLKGMVAEELANRGILTSAMRAETEFDTTFPALAVPDASTPAVLETFRYMPGSGTFSARFLIAGQQRPVIMGGRIDLYIAAPHLAASTSAGTILSPNDIMLRDIPLRYAESQGVASMEELVGKELRRPGYEGLILKASDVMEPDVIARNAEVTVYYRSGPLTITVKGQALNAAAIGEPVSVLNAMSREIISGIATSSGAVELNTAPMTLANL